MTYGKMIFNLILLAGVVGFCNEAKAQAESCSKFTFATSKSRLNAIPITVIKSGAAPILGIAGKTYHFDPAGHCMRAIEDSSKTCAPSLNVISGGKIVARIEGSPIVSLFVTDDRGSIDRTQPHYRWGVQRDIYRTSQPRFWMESVETDGRVLGRIDAVEGLSLFQMNSAGTKEQKIGEAYGAIDLRGTSLLYSNCRKLAKMKFRDEFYARAQRGVASTIAGTEQPLGQMPRVVAVHAAKR